jgi:hypothetical protein
MTEKASRKSTQAVQQLTGAARKRGVAVGLARQGDATGAYFERKEAAALEHQAQAALTLPAPLALSSGGEALPVCAPAEEDDAKLYLRDTLKNPDLVTAMASYDRMQLALQANCLDLALDCAETIQAANSAERMLAHQLAFAHHIAMTTATQGLARLTKEGSRYPQQDSIEGARLMQVAARFMGLFQEGLQTLQKLRTGGKQLVQVQHIDVRAGGQAVVAGAITPGGMQAEGGESKNEGTMSWPTTSTALGRLPAAAPKRARARRVKSPRAEANGAAGCTVAPTPEALEAISMP